MIESPFTPRRAWFLAASVIAFAMVTVFSVYFAIQSSTLKGRLDRLEAQKTALEHPANILAEDATVSVFSAEKLKKQLGEIEAGQLSWSKIIDKIEKTVPRIKDSTDPIVEFRSYSGGEDGKISVNATTRPDSADAFADVALTVKAFAADPSFKNVFVSSITKNLTAEGEIVLSFGINFEYLKANF